MNDVSDGKGEGNRSGESPGATDRSNPLPGVGESERQSVAEWIKQGGSTGSDPGGNGEEGTRSRRSRRRRAGTESEQRSGNQADHGTADGRKSIGGDHRHAAANESGTAKGEPGQQERAKETVSRVEKPKKVPLVVLPGGKKPETLSEDFIAELWKMLYQIPHLAGYDDPQNPWWPLVQHEANALASPSARIIARLTPAEQALFSRFADPIALVVTAVAITSYRAEMTREYVRAQKVHRATEARRAGLSRAVEESDAERNRRIDGKNSDGASPNAESGRSHSHEFIKDTFGES